MLDESLFALALSEDKINDGYFATFHVRRALFND
jgi:hypothetical protein